MFPHQHPAAAETWRQAVDHEIEVLGWRRFTRVDQPEEDVTIYAIDAIAARDLAFHPEGPPTFSLSIFMSGRGTLSIDGARPLTVEPGLGALFTSARYTRGENTVKAGERFQVVDLRFEQRFLIRAGGAALARLGGDLLSEHSLPDQGLFLVGFQASGPVLQAAREIAHCKLNDGTARRLYLYSKAIECLSLVVDSLSAPLRRRNVLRAGDRRRVQQAQELIETRYDVDWTISRLAREVGLNERKLKEGFRQTVGNSVHAHLHDVRIEAAVVLLREGRSVTETALAVGFNSLSHFSKAFSAAKGVQPSRYWK